MPIVAALPAIIGAGGSIAGGLLGGRKSSEQKQLEAAQLNQINQNTAASKYGLDLSKRTQGTAESAYTPALNFFQQLLTGDRSSLNQLLGPQIARVTDQYDVARKRVAEGARGGGATSANVEAEYAPAKQVGDFFLNARPAAADTLGQFGLQLGGLANSQLATGAGVGSSTANAATNALYQQQAANAQQTQQGGQLGSGLAKLAALFLPPKYGGMWSGGGFGSTGSSTVGTYGSGSGGDN